MAKPLVIQRGGKVTEVQVEAEQGYKVTKLALLLGGGEGLQPQLRVEVLRNNHPIIVISSLDSLL